jgi:TonB family protein
MVMADTNGEHSRAMGQEREAARALEIVPVWMGTVMEVTHIVPGPRARGYVVGEVPGASFLLCAEKLAGRESFVLVDADGTVRPPPSADEVVLIRKGGEREHDAGAPTRLADGDCLRVRVGPVVFVIRSVPAARRLRLPFALDTSFLSFTGASFALNVLFLSLAFFFPQDSQHIQHDLDFESSRWGRLLTEPVEMRVYRLPEWMHEAEERPEAAEGGDGERHRDEEGQMGDERNDESDGRYGIEGDADPSERRLAAPSKEQVARAGILGVLSRPLDVPTSQFGSHQALGSDHENALGALLGASVGPNFGFDGLGMTGTGDGGAGDGEGTIGLGTGVWTKIGHGGFGGPDGVGYCAGGHCGGKLAKKPGGKVPSKVEIRGKSEVFGCLSKEVIRRVIRQHLNEVKHCYEKGLMNAPDLSGRIGVKFSIRRDGAVGSCTVTSNTLGDAGVGKCVAKAVKRWSFPPLEGCGVVVVTYPFSFVPASAG